MQIPEPTQQHKWLHQLLGDWTYESEADMGPEGKKKFSGKESVRKLGEFWVIGDGQGEMPGGGAMGHMILTLGFDPQKGRFVGTWIGSMMTYLWVYDGELDASGKVLTLSSDGPDFTDPTKLAQYQDIVTIIDKDHRTLTSKAIGPDGQWMQFMEARYRRK